MVDLLTGRLSGQLLIDVPGRLAMLAAHPGNAASYWIYFTLFSTLVPSVVNVVIGVASIVTWMMPSARKWMVREIPRLQEKGSEGTRRKILAMLWFHVAVGTFITGLLLWGLWWLVENFAPFLLRGFLGGAQWWAGALQVLVGC